VKNQALLRILWSRETGAGIMPAIDSRWISRIAQFARGGATQPRSAIQFAPVRRRERLPGDAPRWMDSHDPAQAEQEKQWFAAAFHFGQMLRDHSDDPDLERRRERHRVGCVAGNLLRSRNRHVASRKDAHAPPR
jgi:hypothetical protein